MLTTLQKTAYPMNILISAKKSQWGIKKSENVKLERRENEVREEYEVNTIMYAWMNNETFLKYYIKISRLLV